ncbi:histidine kinase [Streptomyces sp. NPDC097610]|uniref:sensor histidine kinase n=1 Tax=Streptomyces sp. NPDC097610 TaxID=3157227 RepID=UPI0033339B9C
MRRPRVPAAFALPTEAAGPRLSGPDPSGHGTTWSQVRDPGRGRTAISPLARRIRRIRGHMQARPLVADAVLAVAVALVSLPDLVKSGSSSTAVLLHAGLIAPLGWRRRWPSAVFCCLSAVAFVSWLVDVRTQAVGFSLLVALYTVGRRQPWINALLAAAVMEVGAVLATQRWGHDTGKPAAVVFVLISGTVVAALVLGIYIRTRGAYFASLRDRAERAERERDQLARLAVVEERARIAREMHDIIAHNLSVLIALVDGAASAQERAPHQAAQAMTLAAEAGRKVLNEMRGLLDVTRAETGEAEFHPQPGLEDLDALIDEVRAAGLPVTVETTGPHAPTPPSTGLAVYRVVQESLTNILKHAGTGAVAQVHLEFTLESLKITVTDTGSTTAGTVTHSASTVPGHHGLAGMRERMAVHDGVLYAGPRVGGGWQVNACLPLKARPTPAEAS